MRQRRKWGLLVYISADNNLYAHAKTNLNQMLRAVVDDEAYIVAQVDGPGKPTELYELSGPGGTLQSHLQSSRPNIDGHAFKELEKFLRITILDPETNYPAEQYALVLWGHGQGLDGKIFWDPPEPADAAHHGNNGARLDNNGHNLSKNGKPNSALCNYLEGIGLDLKPQNSAEIAEIRDAINAAPHQLTCATAHLKELGIQQEELEDYDSAKSITNRELGRVLQSAQEESRNRIKILGFDACLMGMVELAYEFRSIPIIVASQTGIPAAGWPYWRILAQLSSALKAGKVEPEEFATMMVSEFSNHYRSKGLATVLSACNLGTPGPKLIESVVEETNTLAVKLVEDLKSNSPKFWGAIAEARTRTQDLRTEGDLGRDYVDLYDFCRVLGQQERELRSDCDAVMTAVRKCLISSNFTGQKYRATNGLSIYFPDLSYPAVLERLRVESLARSSKKGGGHSSKDLAEAEIGRITWAIDTRRYQKLAFAEKNWDELVKRVLKKRADEWPEELDKKVLRKLDKTELPKEELETVR